MGHFLLVCLGGAIGSGARFLAATGAVMLFGSDFPRGTIFVNLLGSFLLALVMGISTSSTLISLELRLFLGAGVMGGFTTYSSFNYETIQLAVQGSWGAALFNVAITLSGCLLSGVAGLALGRALAA
ncbi:MAG TPA: fluoride efflux transporter CrcB [Anaeromyxobacteraceae bacterium]|nr:fluoride efflux transporter CrcB [Anaeromyxobacteraceae bacterium]